MDWLEPMDPLLSSEIIQQEGWLHQIKWDGIRGLCYINNGELRIYTKKGNERTAFYPELKELLSLFKGVQAIFDGEIIGLDKEGKPSFYQSLIRERVRTESKITHYARTYPANYILFDILYLNGEDLRPYPLRDRKELLVKNVNKSGNITITDDFEEGHSLFQLMKAKAWEGIVSKNSESPYTPGKKHSAWYKTKISRKLLAVVGGIQWKNDYPNSLLLGIYHENRLYYIGKASVGLKQRDFQLLKEYSKNTLHSLSPFADMSNQKNVTWLKPFLTCWVGFSEWTNNGHLRHPRIIGFHGQGLQEADGREYLE